MEALDRLQEVTTQLAELHREQATTREGLLREKARLARDMAGEAGSISALDRMVAQQTVDIDVALVRLAGEIAAWREEKDYLMAVLDDRG